MPRGPRISFERAFYHVFNRGVAKQAIYLDDPDYKFFLNRLQTLKTIKQFDHEIYSYILMPNHFHLLIQTKKTSISKIMSSLLTSYSVYFNKKYRRVGPLFQNRFKSKLCDKDSYFIGASRYIHLNPVEAGIVSRFEDYPWSSWQELFGEKTYTILTPDAVRLIGESKQEKENYRKFVEEGLLKLTDLEKEYTFKRDVEGTPRFYSLSQRKYFRRHSKSISIYANSKNHVICGAL